MTRAPKLEIEAGKFYRDGRGEKIGPMVQRPNDESRPWLRKRLIWSAVTPLGYPNLWTHGGRTSLNGHAPRGLFDLYAEWSDTDTPDP